VSAGASPRPVQHDAVAMALDACASATDVSALTPDRVLGITPARVAEARSAAPVPRETEPSAASLRRRGWVVGARSDALVALQADVSIGDADRRAELLASGVARPLGVRLLLGVGVSVSDCVHGDWLALELAPSSQFVEPVEIGGRSFYSDPARGRAGTDAVRLGVEPVARWRGHHLLELCVHPWLGADFGDFQRGRLLRSVLGAAQACRPDPCERTDEPENVDRAVALLDALAVLARALPARTAGALARARGDVHQREREFHGAREALMRALRDRDAAFARRERLERHPDSAAIAELLATLEEEREVATLPPVRSAAVTAIAPEGLGLEVQLHPLVFADGTGLNRLADRMVFVVASEPPTVRFVTQGCSPHPHVDASGSPCLGLAAAPVMAALARGELATAVFLLIGWARQVNRNDCLTRPHCFAVTALAPGWHPSSGESR
jgi:hypothetical protein